MMDINKILGNKKKGTNRINKIIGVGGASIQKQKQWKNFSPIKKNIMRRQYIDSDRDRVPNKWDCQPYNKYRQDGVLKKIDGALGKMKKTWDVLFPEPPPGRCALCGQPREWGEIGHVCKFRSVSKKDRAEIFGEGVSKEEQDEYLRKYAREATEEELEEADDDYNTSY